MRDVQDTIEKAKGLYECGKAGGDIKKYQRNTGVKDQEILYWLSKESDEDRPDIPIEQKLNPHLRIPGKAFILLDKL